MTSGPTLTFPKKRKASWPPSSRSADHVLDLRVVGRDPGADQAERGRQAVEHVDLEVELGMGEQGLGGVEAGRPGADDRDAERVVGGPDALMRAGQGTESRLGGGGSRARWRRRRARRAPGRPTSPRRRRSGCPAASRRSTRSRAAPGRGRGSPRVVALEGDDELLVVDPERVGGVDRDLRDRARRSRCGRP